MTLSEKRLPRFSDLSTTPSRPPHSQPESDASIPARYVADELLVGEEHRRTAWDVLTRRGRALAGTAEDPVAVGGFRRFRVPGRDVVAAAEEIREHASKAGDPAPAVGPNHVFMSTPFEHGGYVGPPVPAPRRPVADLVVRLVADRVRVAVLDTSRGSGQATTEPDHGSFVAGVIAQQTAAAEVRVVRVLDDSGVCTEFDLVRALGRVQKWATLINLSLGGFCVGDQPPAVLGAALARLLATGDRVVVAAAGNDGERERPFWPAAFAGGVEPWARRVVAVAAHDGSDLCQWSNSGTWVRLVAPATGAESPYGPGAADHWSGTSFAAPYVVAALAEQVRASGSALAALGAVVRGATRTYGGYPGLG